MTVPFTSCMHMHPTDMTYAVCLVKIGCFYVILWTRLDFSVRGTGSLVCWDVYCCTSGWNFRV